MWIRRVLQEGEGEGAAGGGSLGISDINAAIESISSKDLGLGEPPESPAASPSGEEGDKPAPGVDDKKLEQTEAEKAAAAAAAQKPTLKAFPKSWKPEMTDAWSKLDPAVQAYIEQRETEMDVGVKPLKDEAAYAKAIRDTLAPYKAMLDAQGHVDHPGIVRGLLGAHYALSHGTVEERIGFLGKIAKQYGLDAKVVAEAFTKGVDEKPFTDPQVEKLAKQFDDLSGKFTTEQQTRTRELAARTQSAVAAFAADPKHLYFNEVSDQIVVLLGDPKETLESAYDKAVWANPVTRAKEQARLKAETEAATRKAAEEEAEKARKAKGTHVRGRETEKAPQDLLGSMEDTMRETLKDIRSRP